MTPSSARVDLLPYIKFLQKTARVSGVSNVNYNHYSQRMELNQFRFRLSRIIFWTVYIVSGVFITGWSLALLLDYTNLEPKRSNLKSTEAQDQSVHLAYAMSEYICTFLFARSYLFDYHVLLSAINEMLDIFKALRKWSDSEVFFSKSLSLTLIYKHSICVVCFLNHFGKFLMGGVFSLNLTLPYGKFVAMLTGLGYVYAHLVLLCFYTKMKQGLKNVNDTYELSVQLRELLTISFRIYRVKHNLNLFFSALFLSAYLGLFADIFHLYEVLKSMVSVNFFKSGTTRLFQMLFHLNRRLAFALNASFDIYLIGRLSDLIIHSQSLFERTVLTCVHQNKLQPSKKMNREIELMLLQDSVYDLTSRACHKVKIDQRFAFEYTINIIFAYAIVFLQFFASETIYSSS